MADISNYIKQIGEAVYGEEVRSSIMNSLTAMNAESEQALSSAVTAQNSAMESSKLASQKAQEVATNLEEVNKIKAAVDSTKLAIDDIKTQIDSINNEWTTTNETLTVKMGEINTKLDAVKNSEATAKAHADAAKGSETAVKADVVTVQNVLTQAEKVRDDIKVSENVVNKAQEMLSKGPKIVGPTWHVYDLAQNKYIDTQVEATGPKGDPGPNGPKGDPGTSAYEAAKAAGFVGTEQEFNESLTISTSKITAPSNATDGQVLTYRNNKWVAENIASDGVTSFNGRTGEVTPQNGDYTAEQVGARPLTWTPTAVDVGAIPMVEFPHEGDVLTYRGNKWTSEKPKEAGVTSFNGRTGEVTPQNGDYTAEQVGAIPKIHGTAGQIIGFTSDNIVGAVDAPKGGGTGKRHVRLIVGTSTAGWTLDDADYICDGTNDDAVINAAIQALPSNGGEIVILDGTYHINAFVAINKSNTKISGNGTSTVLELVGNTEFIMSIDADSCTISDLVFAGRVPIPTYNTGIIINSDHNIVTRINCHHLAQGIRCIGRKNIVISNICHNNGTGIRSEAYDSSFSANVCHDNDIGIDIFGTNSMFSGNNCFRGNGLSGDYTDSQHTIKANNKSLCNYIVANICMGKQTTNGGSKNTFTNNKYQ